VNIKAAFEMWKSLVDVGLSEIKLGLSLIRGAKRKYSE